MTVAEISSMLLDEGVKVDIATESGDTALHWAMFGNKPELIARMIASGKSQYDHE